MPTTLVEARLLALIEDCRRLGIPSRELDEMIALTGAGEPGLALENLCVQLFEYDVPMPTPMVDRIRVVGTAMGLRPDYWIRFGSDAS